MKVQGADPPHPGAVEAKLGAVNKKFHSILLKAFSKSNRRRTSSWSLSTAQSRESWAMKTLSRILLPSTKPV